MGKETKKNKKKPQSCYHNLKRLFILQKTPGWKKAIFHLPRNRKMKVSDRLCVNSAIKACLCHYMSESRAFSPAQREREPAIGGKKI